eukprot:1182119-Prorocentrum_minimum.AAC.7
MTQRCVSYRGIVLWVIAIQIWLRIRPTVQQNQRAKSSFSLDEFLNIWRNGTHSIVIKLRRTRQPVCRAGPNPYSKKLVRDAPRGDTSSMKNILYGGGEVEAPRGPPRGASSSVKDVLYGGQDHYDSAPSPAKSYGRVSHSHDNHAGEFVTCVVASR